MADSTAIDGQGQQQQGREAQGGGGGGGAVQTAKDLFSGAAGGIAQVLIGMCCIFPSFPNPTNPQGCVAPSSWQYPYPSRITQFLYLTLTRSTIRHSQSPAPNLKRLPFRSLSSALDMEE